MKIKSLGTNKVVKSGTWFTISNFVIKGIGFITGPIFYRTLTKPQVAEFDLFLTAVGIMIIITSLNLDASMLRARFDYESRFCEYTFSMVVLSMLSTSLWFVLVNIFIVPIQRIFLLDKFYIELMFVYLFFMPIISLFQNYERYNYRYKLTVLSSLSVSVLTAILSVVLVLNMKDRLLGRVLGFIIPTIVVGVVIISWFIFKVKKIEKNTWKFSLKISIPFIPHLLALFLLGGADKLMIKKMCSSEDLAVYSVAYTVGSLIIILVNSLNSAFSPWLGEKLKEEDYSSIKSISWYYVAFFVYFAGIIVLLSPEVLFVIGGKGYIESKYAMLPVAAGCIMQFLYCMYVNVEQYTMKTKMMAVASVLAAFINIGLNYMLIPLFGYVAAAYTTFASYLILLFFHYIIVCRIGMNKVYDNKKVFSIAICACIFICGVNYILDLYILRYIFVLVYLVVGFIIIYHNKDIILNFLKKKEIKVN